MWAQMMVLGLASLLMITGILGSLIPVLPSTPLVFLGALGHFLCFPQASVSPVVLGILGLMALISLGIDFIASVIGAKRLGATWKGILGVVIGGVVGFFFGLPGVILGPLLGAVLFEMIGGSSLHAAGKAGLGAIIGILAGALGRFAFAIAMTALFFANLFYRQVFSTSLLEVVLR